MYWYNRNWDKYRFVLYREVSFIWRLKCAGIVGIGTSRFVLYYLEVKMYWHNRNLDE